MNTEAPLLFTPRVAAGMLAVCEKTLWNMSQPRGPIPCVRIGRSVRYCVDDLRTFVERQKQQETEDGIK